MDWLTRALRSDIPICYLEMRKALWNKGTDLRDKIIYDVTFSQPDFDRVQNELDKNYPLQLRSTDDRRRPTAEILAIKHSVIKAKDEAHLLLMEDSPMSDAAETTDSTQIPLPATMKVLDLRPLKLTRSPFFRRDRLIIIRDEYLWMLEKLKSHDRGLPALGGAFISGQAGTGLSYFLIFVLVMRLLDGLPTIYQDGIGLFVFENKHDVWRLQHPQLPDENGWGEDVWALVDGNARTPHNSLLYTYTDQVRIVMAASSELRDNRKWIERKGVMEYVLRTWSRQELFVAGHFFYPDDMTNERLIEAVARLGHSPRKVFKAARGPSDMKYAINAVTSSVWHIHDIHRCLLDANYWGPDDDAIFEINPGSQSHWLNMGIIRPTSQWAFDQLLVSHSLLRAGSSLELFENIWFNEGLAAVTTRIWERGVLNFFAMNRYRKSYILRSLDTETELPDEQLTDIPTPQAGFHGCKNYSDMESCLVRHVVKRSACYLFPTWENLVGFSGIHGIIYVPGTPLTCIQATLVPSGDLKVDGLEAIERIIHGNQALKVLRPTSSSGNAFR
ncbi:hypothetical protein BD410DRAFT_846438 [Rickenella mellea]|uniref:Uncharacterized protein n=1 Tax=Rickenella mellea TaxID=50990 RepID=A0A4Y7PFF9_9AGAM|nr:hypothetical protein BD410DRAFT_846438 [Rickenella mellea]